MAPAIFSIRGTPDADDISSIGPLRARSILLGRDSSGGSYTPGSGVVAPGDINNTAVFVLFGLIGAAFVVTAIWFFFRAKNGGFHFKKDDWDEYKSTVLRRKGPNGTILSGATPSTVLGGGSIYKDVDDGTTESGSGRSSGRGGDEMTVVSGTTGLTGLTGGVSDFAGREKRRRKREQKEREKERRREEKEADKKDKKKKRSKSKTGRRVGADGVLIDEDAEAEAKEHLRQYRHEKPARVGGLNKEGEGSSWDGSTNPSHSTASGSAVGTSTVESGSAVTSELMAHRERTPTTTPTGTPTKKEKEKEKGKDALVKRENTKKDKPPPARSSAYTSYSGAGGAGGIRKVYSTADKTASRENERLRAEARRLQEKGRAAARAAARRDFSWKREDDALALRRIEEAPAAASESGVGSGSGAGESSSRVSYANNRVESEAPSASDAGTKIYRHSVHIPGTASSDFAYTDEKRKKRQSRGA